MRKAPLMSLLRKKPEKLAVKAAKRLMEKVQLMNLLRKKPEKQAVKAAKLPIKKALPANPDSTGKVIL
jgi:hypothetical protein